jgi:hypothetical protein
MHNEKDGVRLLLSLPLIALLTTLVPNNRPPRDQASQAAVTYECVAFGGHGS